MTKFLWFILAWLVLAGLASCMPLDQIPPTPTQTTLPTPTSTSTPVWFPPTPTNTPVPAVEPTITPDMRSGVGPLILEDDFSSTGAWLLGQSARGTVSIGANELSFALTQPGAYLFSTRTEPTFGNFYAEVTASPNLCAGLDEYGLLFRVRSTGDFYRYSLSCDGQVRLDRVVGGTGGSPQPWLRSASVPSGAPSSSRLGVWALGREMRFFINGDYQFSISDSYHASGLLGVFARSGGENAVSVSFSDLEVYQVGQ